MTLLSNEVNQLFTFQISFFVPKPSSTLTVPSMEPLFSTFQPFARLPKELRLQIWRLALPARTIEQTWNNSKLQWEFVAKVPRLFQCVYEVRDVYREIDDVLPFYFCSTLDTIYVRRQCVSGLSLL